MNTYNEFQLIWEYNLLRTFVRHICMVTCDPYGKLNNRNLKYIYGDGKAKDEGCEPSESCILNNAIGVMSESYYDDKAKKEIVKEILPCMFLKGLVIYSDQNSEEEIFKDNYQLGKFATELPEIRNVGEFDDNLDKVVDFTLCVKSHELSSLGKYSICGHSILTIADHLLNLMKDSGYAVKSDFKLPESESYVDILYTLPEPNPDTIIVNEYPHWRSKEANDSCNGQTTKTGFDLSGDDIDYTNWMSDADQEAVEIAYSNQLFTLLLDSDDYFVRGVIVPMMAAYIGCDHLFELKQDKNADVHLNRLYDMVKEQIDVNDHKSVLDYMSKVKFMISALLPNE